MIELKNLSIGYNSILVSDISLEIFPGEIISILGPNGVGKTTLFKTILQVLPPLGGKVLIDGEDISALSAKRLAKLIAYVPQLSFDSLPFNVFEVVLMGRTAHLNGFESPGRDDEKKVYEILKDLNLLNLSSRAFNTLSGGEKQKVNFARALAQEAKYIFLDEPTSALDYSNSYDLMNLILNLKDKGYAVIMTTHSPDQALKLGSKVILFKKDGNFVIGSAKDVISSKNLKSVYGTDAYVADIYVDGQMIPICTPIFKRKGV